MSKRTRTKKTRRQLVKRIAKYTAAAAACGAVAGTLPEKSEADIVAFAGPFTSSPDEFVSLDMTVGASIGYVSAADFKLGASGGFAVFASYAGNSYAAGAGGLTILNSGDPIVNKHEHKPNNIHSTHSSGAEVL